ncbi:MAG: DUF417 family protein [Candidatus Yanofskybacteria bacterium]|nr:DUF417 family protein [Candidatus Yanofskybacteria bacterium]
MKYIELKNAILYMRIALGIIFLWFGLLKFSGNNPVYDIVYASFPFLADGIGNYILASFETIIGIGLFLNVVPKIVHFSLILHLMGTFSVFLRAPEIMFYPSIPFLTLAGEFVVKNIALTAGGFVVLAYSTKK